MRTYQYKPPQASDGKEFEALCSVLYKELLGETLHLCITQEDQYKIGDTQEGHEFKELQNSHERFHIEVSENNDRVRWFPSGIYAPNRKWYVCGSKNAGDIWCFKISDLTAYHKAEAPPEVWYGGSRLENYLFDGATIQSFVLYKIEAQRFFVHRFKCYGDRWQLVPRYLSGLMACSDTWFHRRRWNNACRALELRGAKWWVP